MTQTYGFQTNIGDNQIWVTALITPGRAATEVDPPEYPEAEISEVKLIATIDGAEVHVDYDTQDRYVLVDGAFTLIDDMLARKAVEKWEMDI